MFFSLEAECGLDFLPRHLASYGAQQTLNFPCDFPPANGRDEGQGWRGNRITNESRSSSVSNTGVADPLAAVSLRIFGMPVDRPSVISNS